MKTAEGLSTSNPFIKDLEVSAVFMNNPGLKLDYSRVEVAADARLQPMKLWLSTASGCNEADVVRSARPLGKKC
ncbi:hypothetical protein ACFLQZ_03140 [Acidobacteriota bacterium]